MENIKLAVKNISKKYPGTIALDNVSLNFCEGEVHALIGKNGAGKSTLVKVISGAVSSDAGEIFLDGQKVILANPEDALHKGVVSVYQELSLIPGLTIAENILLGRTPKKKVAGIPTIDWNATFSKARAILHEMGLDLDVKLKANQINIAQQQIVEIAKAMSYNPSVLILDEPTSALAFQEVDELFRLIKGLVKKGVAIIYISHRIQEVLQISDCISVLRDAKLIGTIKTSEATPQIISEMMFGEVVQKKREEKRESTKNVVLSVKNLNKKNTLYDINFSLYEGEILGIAGLMGSGRTELLRILFGVDSYDSGKIFLKDKEIIPTSPIRMKRNGVGLTPEDRKYQGLVQIMSIKDNLSLTCLDRISTKGVINKRQQINLANEAAKNLHIKISGLENPVYSLSGGNQQKVVIGKWLNTQPKILLFDEPTRGIDIHAKQEIFQIIRELSKNKISIIFVSTELEEVIEVADRILVMKSGRIVDEIINSEEVTMNRLLELCIKE